MSLAARALIYHEGYHEGVMESPSESVDYLGPRVIAENVTVTQHGSLTTVRIPFAVGTNGHLHLNGTGGCKLCCNTTFTAGAEGVRAEFSNPSSPVALVDPDQEQAKVHKTETFVIDSEVGVLTATIPGWNSSAGRVEVQFLFDNAPQCAVYNGRLSGPDSIYAPHKHFGIVAQSWRGNVTISSGDGKHTATAVSTDSDSD
jgi:hypothetical protein